MRKRLEAQLAENSKLSYAVAKRQEERHQELRRMRIYREILDEATTLQERRIAALEKGQVRALLAGPLVARTGACVALGVWGRGGR